MDLVRLKRSTFTVFASVVAVIATACGGGTTGGATPPAAVVPSDLSISSFTQDFSYMPKLKDLVTAGKGMVGVILPDTTSSLCKA